MFHLCAGSVFPILLLFLPRTPLLAAAITLLVVVVAAEGLRFRYQALNQWLLKLLRPLLKRKEDRSPLGSTYWLVATPVVIGLMAQPVAVLALFYTSIGDSLAALVGERQGRFPLWGKSLQGSAAFLASSLAIGGLLLATGLETTLAVMLVGALAATLLELLPLPFDDNLRVPLGSGVVMLLAARFWG